MRSERIYMDSSLESLENPAAHRLSAFPIQHQDLYDAYKKAQASFWVEEEIDSELSKDKAQWDSLTPEIRRFVTRILAFFAVSDGVVCETVQEEILSRVVVREAMMWYNYQVAIEDIHNLVYSKLVETYVTSSAERRRVLDAAATFPIVSEKIQWVRKWVGAGDELSKISRDTRDAISLALGRGTSDDDALGRLREAVSAPRVSLAKVVFVNAIMEGVFFSGSFCAIFWVSHHYKMLPGLTKANEFISRDEGMHTAFATHLYNRHIATKLAAAEATQIMREAVEIESRFICDALPTKLPGMNSELMTQYVEFTADRLLTQMGYQKVYGVEQPFPFMEKQSISVRITDFFNDLNVSEYKHFASGLDAKDFELDFSEDF
jgi:ribonucleoside-diphosphate reductase beta chain